MLVINQCDGSHTPRLHVVEGEWRHEPALLHPARRLHRPSIIGAVARCYRPKDRERSRTQRMRHGTGGQMSKEGLGVMTGSSLVEETTLNEMYSNHHILTASAKRDGR